MKKAFFILTEILRIAIVLSALWLVIDSIYYHRYGDYLLYYKSMSRESRDMVDYMRIVRQIYSNPDNRLAIWFTSQYVPVLWWITIFFEPVDVCIAMWKEGKTRIVLCVITFICVGIIHYLKR